MLIFAAFFGLFATPELLTSFESNSDLQAIDHAGVTIERVDVHATEGKFALKAVFQNAEWPHLLWSPKQPLDWRNAGGLAIDVFNPSDIPVELGIRVDDDPTADGSNHSRSCTLTLAPKTRQSVAILLGLDPMKLGMRGLPSQYDGLSAAGNGEGDFNPEHIVAYQFFMHKPPEGTTLFFDNLHTLPSTSSAKSLIGIVDRYGQYAKANWPGKVAQDTELATRAKAEASELNNLPRLPGRDKFGGWEGGPTLKATGFFRTEKVHGKWWLVDPDGKLFFSFGIDVILASGNTVTSGRESMFSWLPKPDEPLSQFLGTTSEIHLGPVKQGKTFDFYRANLYRKFGPGFESTWYQNALKRLPSWGFNTVGNWSDDKFYGNNRLPYVATGGVYGNHATVSSGSDYWGRMPDPFDKQFAEDARTSLLSIVAKVKSDSWCLGYFVDNELSWAGNGPDGPYGLAIGALSESPSSPARKAFIAQLQSRYSDIASVNASWGSSAISWDSLRLPSPLNASSRKDAGVFVKQFARRYFSVIRDVLRQGDPNHLYLGCRFAWRTPEAEDAAAEFCDVVSFNIYAPKLDDSWKAVERFDRPCIIGEFHFGALDRGMFHPGLVSTPNQTARATMYEDYLRSVLTSPSFVGCHWFQYIDEPLTGRTYDGENYNIGFVNVTDTPYPEMIAAARRIHGEAYAIRSGGSK